MEIPNSIIAGSFAFPIAVAGIIWGMLRSEIKSGDVVLLKKIDKVEIGLNSKMSKGGCQRVQDHIKSESIHIKELVNIHTDQYSKDHYSLIRVLDTMDKKQDATNEGMAEVITCLALLSESIPCTPGKKFKEKEVKK